MTDDRRSAFEQSGLLSAGFSGFLTATEIVRLHYQPIPVDPGVYVVCRSATTRPAFLRQSAGGWFKAKDPTVPVDVLEAKWVTGASVVYIGKAGAGSAGRGLRKRLGELVRYGQGKPVGHQGGRYLWQLADHTELVFGWLPDADPRPSEQRLLRDFAEAYGALPFANLTR